MADYYFDIETYTKTEKPDVENDEILTIQFQQIDSRTGQKRDELKILKDWESSEKDILQKFFSVFNPKPVNPKDTWNFIPIGYNLPFDFTSLLFRWEKIGIEVPSRKLFYEKPYLDIKPIVIMFNKGSFTGAKLEKFIGKQHSGIKVSEWYEQKDYASIQKYIEDEAEGFINLYQCLVHKLPNIWFEYAKEKGIMI
jgi:DNA polymerase elongation subunit (family B)